MIIYALVPARGGSTRIKNKNVQPIKKVPLVNWTLHDAFNSKHISNIFLSTNDEMIQRESLKIQLKGDDYDRYHLIERPDEICQSNSTTETAIQHFLDTIEKCDIRRPDIIVLMQCTTPFREPGIIDQAIEKLIAEQADSLFFAADLERYIWTPDNEPINYDYQNRPMTQDVTWDLVEGGDYIFRTNLFHNTGMRLGGKIIHQKVGKIYNMDIDEQEDLDLCRAVAETFNFKPEE